MANYASDAWLATFPRDVSDFIAWEAFTARNGYTLFTIGNQTGDLPDYKTAEAKANALIASGKPAGILFRRGQTFAAQANDSFQTNGLSPQLPFLVGSTFDLNNPRPILQHATAIGNARQATKNICVFGLSITDPNHDPALPTFQPTAQSFNAVYMNSCVPGGQNVLVEDVAATHCGAGFNLLNSSGGSFESFIIRRCAVVDCWQYKPGQASYGVFEDEITDFLIDSCLFDRNGWSPATNSWPGYAKNDMSHNLYLHQRQATDSSDPQTRVINCINARAAATGNEQRSGGLDDGNLYLGNPIAAYSGNTGTSWQISNAVVDGGGTSTGAGEFDLAIAAAGPRGWGVFLNCVPGGLLSNILCINKPDAVNGGFAISVKCDSTPPIATVATIGGCIVHGWTGTAFDVGGVPGSLTFSGNNDLGIPTIAPAKVYFDSTRTTASYANSLGIAGVTNAATFLVAAANNYRGNWDPRLTAANVNTYIRAGFQLKR